MLKKIISGGQPGVEMAALEAAAKLDIPHEGWAFHRKMAEDELRTEEYNLKALIRPSYHERLKKNIVAADGTVVMTYGQLVLGMKAIEDLAEKHQKPYLKIDLTECSINHAISSIRRWMTINAIETIYFTGSKPVGESTIFEETIQIVEGICSVEREQKILPEFSDKDGAPSS